ncbi:MAG TPA: ATP-binding protein [Longimicrobiales bacterium]
MPDRRPTARTGVGRSEDTRRVAVRMPLRPPLALSALLLLALILVQVTVDQRRLAIRREIAATTVPARAAAQAVQAAIAQQSAALRAYLLTGDPDFLERYAEASRAERRHLETLRAHSANLGAGWRERVDRIVRESRAWHAMVERSGLLTEAEPSPAGRRIAVDPYAHDALNEAVADLGRGLTALERASWRELTGTARLEIGLTVMLVVLSLGLVVLNGWAGRRTQRMATFLRALTRDERLFRRISHRLAAADSPEALAECLADGALALTAAIAVYVERVLPGREWVAVAATAGVGTLRVGQRAPYPGSLSERMLERGEPEFFAAVDRLDAPMASKLAEACAGCAGLVVPLAVNGRALGALVLVRAPGQGRFDRRETTRIRVLGDFASLALLRIMLLREAEQRSRLEAEHAAEAEQQRARTEQLMRGKARFIRGFSHDLKNPLGAIIGYADLLEAGVKGELTAEQKDGVRRIGQAARSALKLIEDLVELSQADAGELSVERGPAALRGVILESTEQVRAQAESAGLELETDVPPDLPDAYTDGDRVRQILGNLLSNAIKYTPEGGRIRVAAATRPGTVRDRTGEWLAIAVSDTGPGIAPEDIGRLFREFSRLRRTKRGGTGLGLAISRRIARLLDGDITVESELGRGSTFTLWLPLATGVHAAGGRAA